MAYLAASSDDEELKKKNAGIALGGEAESGAVAGQDAATKAQPYTQTGFASAKNIFNKNQGAADQYDVTQPFAEDLSKGKAETESSFKTLQENLGKQVQGAKSTDNDLADAISAGQGSAGWGKVMSALNPAQIKADQYKLAPKTNTYNANNITDLNTSAGIQTAIANQAEKKGVQNYSQGMGSLDAAIYQKDAGYRNKVAGLSKQYAEADKQRQNYADQTNAAVEKSNKELQDYSASVRGKLDDRANFLKAQADVAQGNLGATRYNDRRQAAYQDAVRQQREALQNISGTIADPYSRNEFLLQQQRQPVDLGQYYSVPTQQYDYSDQEAGQFNNIMAMLGKTERATSGNESAGGFNRTKYENDLKARASGQEASTTKQRQDSAAAQAEIQKQKDFEEQVKLINQAKSGYFKR